MILGTDALLTAYHAGLLKAYVNTTNTEGKEVEREMTEAELRSRLGPNSIDVTLAPKFLFPRHTAVVDVKAQESLKWEEHTADSICLLPHGYHPSGMLEFPMRCTPFALGCARERFEFQTYNSEGIHVCQFYEGRSTMGRIGIASHITAGFGDVGFKGAFTLELVNLFVAPVILYAGMRIGQISFRTVERPSSYRGAYSGKEHYHQPVAPVLGPSRFFLEGE